MKKQRFKRFDDSSKAQDCDASRLSMMELVVVVSDELPTHRRCVGNRYQYGLCSVFQGKNQFEHDMLSYSSERTRTLESDDVRLYTGTYYLYNLICLSLQFHL